MNKRGTRAHALTLNNCFQKGLSRKRSQAYIIATIVIVGIIAGFTFLSDYEKKDSSSVVSHLKKQLETESQKTLNYGFYNKLDDAGIENLTESFAKNFDELIGENVEVYFITGVSRGMNVYYFDEERNNISISQENESYITFNVDQIAYQCKIMPGYNFYFILKQEIGDEKYIEISDSCVGLNYSGSLGDNEGGSYNPTNCFNDSDNDGWYEICTCEDLINISDDLSANYILMNNIDCSDTINWNGGEGWNPLGDGASFNGNLNGDGFTIQDLYINRPTENAIGLFAIVKGDTSHQVNISDIVLENINITGDESVGGLIGGLGVEDVSERVIIKDITISGIVRGNRMVGGLIGDNNREPSSSYWSIIKRVNVNADIYGEGSYDSNPNYLGTGGLIGDAENLEIEDSHFSGTVQGRDEVGGIAGDFDDGFIKNCSVSGVVEGEDYVGGIIGHFDEDASSKEELIEQSFSTSSVIATGNYVGGLVGKCEEGREISDSYSSGDVTGENNVGGLVGEVDESVIESSYSSGDVTGGDNVGGFVGYIHSSSSILNSFSTGDVTGDNNVGGFIGRRDSSTVSNSYWYDPSTGLPDCGYGIENGIDTESTLSYFYDNANPPMNSWGSEWSFSVSSLPKLTWE